MELHLHGFSETLMSPKDESQMRVFALSMDGLLFLPLAERTYGPGHCGALYSIE
jgi:hypothetical protein